MDIMRFSSIYCNFSLRSEQSRKSENAAHCLITLTLAVVSKKIYVHLYHENWSCVEKPMISLFTGRFIQIPHEIT